VQTEDGNIASRGPSPGGVAAVRTSDTEAAIRSEPKAVDQRPAAGPGLSAIIVSYNTRDLLARSIHSILPDAAGLEVECVVVDNDSRDGSADMVAAEFPSVKLYRAPRNLGFAAGVNEGVRRSKGRYVLLLNPDAELLDDSLARMVAFLDSHPRAAAVGPQLEYADGARQHAAFTFPTLPMIFLDYFPLHGRILESRLNGRYPPADEPHLIDHPLGACMLVRREAFDDVGLFDEDFFIYCEEVDWCLRAQRKGWQIYHLPAARARHLSAASTSQQRDAMLVELHRSRLRLYRKHYGPLFRTLARGLTRIGLWAEERRLRRAAARGAVSAQGLSSRLAALRQIRDLLRHDA
jgi:GT2 family glycosyltransferase